MSADAVLEVCKEALGRAEWGGTDILEGAPAACCPVCRAPGRGRGLHEPGCVLHKALEACKAAPIVTHEITKEHALDV